MAKADSLVILLGIVFPIGILHFSIVGNTDRNLDDHIFFRPV